MNLPNAIVLFGFCVFGAVVIGSMCWAFVRLEEEQTKRQNAALKSAAEPLWKITTKGQP